MKTMESIHIDVSKKIFLLNGRPMRDVSELHLDFEKGEWSLQVTEMVTYTEAHDQRPDEQLGKDKIKFSRENIEEFIRAVAPETEKISISLSAEGDEVILRLPFTKEILSVKGGESIQFGAVIPGSIPQRRVMSVQSDE